jgi:hypothetical protein
MMTGVIERLGVGMVHTTEDTETREKAQAQYKARFGAYVPNEHFYEITHDQFSNWMKIYNTPFSGCKVIIPVNGIRWEAVCSQPAKVIMMDRDPAEIRQSQEAFYKKARAKYDGEDPIATAEAHIRSMLANTRVMLDRRTRMSHDTLFGQGDVAPFDYKVVKYRDVLFDPEKQVGEVARFIGADLDRIGYAAASVDSSKIRFRREDLDDKI